MAEVTLDLLGQLLQDLQVEATHQQNMYDCALKQGLEIVARLDALSSRVVLVDGHLDLIEKRLQTRLDGLREEMIGRVDTLNGRLDTLEVLLRKRVGLRR